MLVCLKQDPENKVLVVLLQIGAKDLTVLSDCWAATAVRGLVSLHSTAAQCTSEGSESTGVLEIDFIGV